MKIIVTEKYTTLSNKKQIVNNKDVISIIVKKKTKTKVLHS